MRVSKAFGILVVTGLVTAALSAQDPRPAQPAATLDDLVSEVRGLRAEINQSAIVSIRTQLLTARLQLQEQRIYAAARQLTEAQGLLATVHQEIATQSADVTRWEEAEASLADESERRALRQMIPQVKAQIEAKRQREQDLRRQEAELINALNSEQARWTEFNGRLDEIERSLSSSSTR